MATCPVNPCAYLERANTLDPDHQHTLWLLAIARQQAGDHQNALEGFRPTGQHIQDNPEALATIEQMRARSLEATAGGAGAATSNSAN